MKFLNLQLRAFGCFTNRTLNFADGNRNFHLIYGANEAGKSTSLRAVKGLLFEIPSRSDDDYIHKSAQLRVAAELLCRDGRRRVFVRRKGNKDTLLDEQEQPIPTGELSGFLGNLGHSTFESVFCLDHHVLRQGGADLLAGKGELAESLFQAGTGLTGLRGMLAQLEQEAEKIFKARGSIGALNQSLAAYEEARRRSREFALSPKDWAERSAELARMNAELADVRTRLQTRRAQLNRLGRYQVALKHFTQYRLRLGEWEQLKDVVTLPPTAPQEHAEVRGQINHARTQIENTRKRIVELEEQLKQLQVPGDLLAQAATIGALVQRLDGYRNANRDLPKVKAEHDQRRADSLNALAELKPGLPLEEADRLRISETLRERISRLGREHTTLTERLDQQKRALEKARKNAAATEAELAECPAVPAVEDLEAALESCRTQGDLEGQLQTEGQTLKASSREIEVLWARLGVWPVRLSGGDSKADGEGLLVEKSDGSARLPSVEFAPTNVGGCLFTKLDAVARLPLPLPESIDRFDRELSTLAKSQEKLADEAKRLRESVANVQRETQSLQLAGAVPTETDLAAARERREAGWQLVRRAWLEQANDPGAERAFDSQRPLPDAYAQSVKDADDLADRLRRESERCAQLASLKARELDAHTTLREVLSQQQLLADQMANWQQRWQAEWAGAGISPLSPAEMRSWLSRHAALTQKAEELRRIQERVERLKEAREQHVAALRGALERLTQTPILADDPGVRSAASHAAASVADHNSLAALMKSAKKICERIRDAAEMRKDLEKSLKRQLAEAKRSEEEVQPSRQTLEEWQVRWSDALTRAQLPGDTLPEDAVALMTKLDRLFDSLRDQGNMKSRINLMLEYKEAFDHDTRGLTGALASDLSALPSDAAIEQLQSRLARAKADEVRRKGLLQQLFQEKESLAAAENARSQTEARWQTLLERARCSTGAELEVAEQRSQQKREVQQSLATHRESLENQSGGSAFDVFLAELDALKPDEIPGQFSELEQLARHDESRQSELLQVLAVASQKLKDDDHSTLAVQAAQDTQDNLAQVRESAMQYARLRLAAEILRRQMELHREKNQDPVIRRASELLPRLTRGSLARLKVGFDDRDQSILVGVRGSGEEVMVSGMSDGTRDQLFLALRLASLERQLQSAEPIPLIVDDILINFDDDRSRATLEVLHEISRSTQVLFFTHHTRLKELAREIIANEEMGVHEL